MKLYLRQASSGVFSDILIYIAKSLTLNEKNHKVLFTGESLGSSFGIYNSLYNNIINEKPTDV